MRSQGLSTTIIRTAEALELDGIQATTFGDLAVRLEELAGDSAIVISDLSLGSWRSHQVATEFSMQVDEAGPVGQADVDTAREHIFPTSLADAIGAWIDLESRGDSITLGALDRAARLVDRLDDSKPMLFAVLLPRFGLSAERADVLFLRFLAEGIRGSRNRLVVVWTDAETPVVPREWRVHWLAGGAAASAQRPSSDLDLIPGILCPTLDVVATATASAGPVLRNLGSAILIAPECRRPPSTVSRFEFDRLASRTSTDWLRAYAMYYGNNCYVDVLFLLGQSAQQISEGGETIGLRLLERASTCANGPIQRAVLKAQLQGLRIALKRYSEALSEADPSPHLPDAVRGILLETKGWAVLMADDPTRAEAYLQQASQLLEPTLRNTREYLYLQNIHALALLQSGDVAGAFGREHAIERSRQELDIADGRLAYVNLINLARLYRLNGQFDWSAAYYDQAFATTLGIRSESDCLYTNACMARIEEARGRVDEAFFAWLRAGLHWVSSRAPEALGSRVVTMLLDRRPPVGESVVSAVSEVLLGRLVTAARSAGFPPIPLNGDSGDGDESAPTFARSPPCTVSEGLPPDYCAVGAPGWGVFLSGMPMPSSIRGGAYQRLGRGLVMLLHTLCPRAEVNRARTVFVDDQFGREIPTTFDELVGSCVRRHVERLCYGDSQILMDQATRMKLERASKVQISPCFDRLSTAGDQKVVTFRRALSPRPLSPMEACFLDVLGGGSCLGDLCNKLQAFYPFDTIIKAARSLERDRVLCVTPPEHIDLCRSGVMSSS